MKNLFSIPLLLMFSSVTWSNTAHDTDVAYDRLAQRLEVVRNQIELTIENQESLKRDLERQKREQEAMQIFLRIPFAKHDLKNDQAILESIKEDLHKAQQNFRIKNIKFISGWKSAPHQIPDVIGFDEMYLMSEAQIADSRDLSLEIEFKNKKPQDLKAWFSDQQNLTRRLLVAKDPHKWKRNKNQMKMSVTIFRYRDVEYPKLAAPDLSRYATPNASQPVTKTQNNSLIRIQKYRQQIVQTWPQVQPYLDTLRTFALNDQRMKFFLKRANVHE